VGRVPSGSDVGGVCLRATARLGNVRQRHLAELGSDLSIEDGWIVGNSGVGKLPLTKDAFPSRGGSATAPRRLLSMLTQLSHLRPNFSRRSGYCLSVRELRPLARHGVPGLFGSYLDPHLGEGFPNGRGVTSKLLADHCQREAAFV
jgi:hypothetical protein